jgi:hypothetical protein
LEPQLAYADTAALNATDTGHRRLQRAMGIGDRIDKLENYYRPGGAGGTPRKIPEPTDEVLIEIVSALYDAIGENVEVFARGIGMDREGAEEVIARILERREVGARNDA